MPDKKNSAARIQANNKYNAKAYDRINIAIPKGRKATIEEAAVVAGKKGLIEKGTINGLLNLLLREYLGLSESEWKSPGDTAPEAVPLEASDVSREEPAEAVDRAQVEAVQPVEAAHVEMEEAAAALDHVETVPEVEPVEDAVLGRAEDAQPFELYTLCVPYGRRKTLKLEAAKNQKQISEVVRYAVECYLPDDEYLPDEMSFMEHFEQARAAIEDARADDEAKSNKASGDYVTVYFERGSLEVIEELARKRNCNANRIINLALAQYFELSFAEWKFEKKEEKPKREKLPWESGLY